MSIKAFLPSVLPLIQAPMAGVQGPALAIAVAGAGGLGSIPAAMLDAARLEQDMRATRAGTNGAFNVNFFCHTPPVPDAQAEQNWRDALSPYYAEAGLDITKIGQGPGRNPFDEMSCALVEALRPAVVSFHFGLPDASFVARVKAAGALVLSSATTVAEARWLEEHGADAIIAQGTEAGGHRGMFLTHDINAQPGLFALLPQVVDAVSVPVIAAGAIADGRGIAAAFALGADAVQIGTAYLRTPEATTSAIHRAALAHGRDDETRLTNLFTGRPARGLLNRVMRDLGPISDKAPAFPLATTAIVPLRAHAEKQGSSDFTPLWSGQAGALAREEGAKALTEQLWAEACAIMGRDPRG